MSPATLPPTLRTPKRYVFVAVEGEEAVPFQDVVERLWHTIIDTYGMKGVATMECWFMKNLYDEETATGVIRINKDHVEELRASIALMDPFGEGVMYVRGTSGTIKAGAKKFLDRNISMLS